MDYVDHQIFGSGETVVLLPSNWLTSMSYKTFAEKLSSDFSVIVPNLYRGRSQFDSNARHIDDYTKKLNLFLRGLKLKKYYLVGSSFSGLIAIDYLSKYPKDLKKVIIVGMATQPVISKESKITLFSGIVSYIKLFLHNLASVDGIKVDLLWLYDGFFNCFIRHPIQFVLDGLIAMRTFNRRSLETPVPTKIIMATKDEFIPCKNVNRDIKMNKLDIEIVEGYHGWFFLKDNILVEKINDFF
jgi:pimeloyl-ACP methyl ester carboxylesterase